MVYQGPEFLPNPVNQLASDALNGKLSRRQIIKRGSALGLSAGLMGSILTLQRTGAQDATPAGDAQAAGYSIEVPEGLRTDLTGSISVVLGADDTGLPFEEAMIAKFVEATGVQVERIPGAESATDRLTFYLQVLGAEASDVDAMQIDVIWPGILAPHAVDLADTLADQGVEYIERIVENNTVDGKLVGIPWYTDAGLLYYRTDLLEKYGFDGPPATWAELEEMANAMIEGEADNTSFTGFTFQANAYEGLTCNALEWQVSEGGGEIIEADGTVSVNNEQAIAAMERAAGWVGTIAPEGVTTYQEEDARGVWQGGNAAFMRNWPYAYSLGAADDSTIAGKFDVTSLPMGDGPDARNAATLGGWQMMVSQYSENVDAATEFAKYVTSREVQKARAIERSLLPTIPDLYEDEDVLAANPFYSRLLEVFTGAAVARPSTVSADLYNEVSTAYFTQVNRILTGEAEAADAFAELEGQLEDIMADL
ncbi:MAG: ABC transporter substrate-binding protein [Chloroflexota bacterium]|nr:ABC transporter substrate-binding protein [Chloroflexota bacterium]